MTPPLTNTKAHLRIALDAPDGFDRCQHREFVERVQDSLPHSVVYRELGEGSTCVTYCLGLFRHKAYVAIAGAFFGYKIFAGRQFVEWLLNDRLSELDHVAPGCLALYFGDGIWHHAGTVLPGGRVVSKWGTFPVYEHEVLEVPARYGNQVRYFAMPTDPLRMFIDFSKSLGLRDEDISEAIQFEG